MTHLECPILCTGMLHHLRLGHGSTWMTVSIARILLGSIVVDVFGTLQMLIASNWRKNKHPSPLSVIMGQGATDVGRDTLSQDSLIGPGDKF